MPLLFIDEDNLIEDLSYSEPLWKSDHVALQWNLLLEMNEPTGCQDKKNYWKGDYEKITIELQRSVGMRNYRTNHRKKCG